MIIILQDGRNNYKTTFLLGYPDVSQGTQTTIGFDHYKLDNGIYNVVPFTGSLNLSPGRVYLSNFHSLLHVPFSGNFSLTFFITLSTDITKVLTKPRQKVIDHWF